MGLRMRTKSELFNILIPKIIKMSEKGIVSENVIT